MLFSRNSEAKQALKDQYDRLNNAIYKADIEEVLSTLDSGPLDLNGRRFLSNPSLLTLNHLCLFELSAFLHLFYFTNTLKK